MSREHSSKQDRDIRKLRIESIQKLDTCVQLIKIWNKHDWLLPGEYDALMDIVEGRACGIEALSD